MCFGNNHVPLLFRRFAQTLSKEEITGIIKAHSERVVTSAFRPIYISRGNVWTTALRQFSRRRFAESTDVLYVTFASDEDTDEDAEDLGGPRREFFRLLVKAIYKESGAFEGNLFLHKCYVLLNVLLCCDVKMHFLKYWVNCPLKDWVTYIHR